MKAVKSRKIYLIHCKTIDLYKIGISVNPKKRVKQLQTGTPYELSLISTFESEKPFRLEKVLHNMLQSKQIPDSYNLDFELLNGEWFNLDTKDVLGFYDLCQNIEKNFESLKKEGNPFIK